MKQEAVIEKVVKLLNLANDRNNDNDAECKLALLFAQRLMAKYKISEDQISSEESREKEDIVKAKCQHKDNKGFRTYLAVVIADNFRVKAYMEGNTVVFFGEKTDAIIAKKAFEFAYKYIVRRGTYYEDKVRAEYGTAKGVFNSYAQGYILGIKEALAEQSVALMIVTPKRVEEEFSNTIMQNSRTYSGGMRQDYVYSEYVDNGKRDAKNHFGRRKITQS